MSTADVREIVEIDRFRGLRVVEYDALVATGLLDGEPLELIEGALVRVSPQGAGHAEAIGRVMRALDPQVPAGWQLRIQTPLALGDRSEPEPDVAVVPEADYSHAHPTAAALVVEVSASSRPVDLGLKARMYAAGGVGEYWVLDLAARVLVVHRRPGPTGYGELSEHTGVVASAEPALTLDTAAVLPSA